MAGSLVRRQSLLLSTQGEGSRNVLCHLLSVICCLMPVVCSAEELSDPTRPPEIFTAVAPVSGVAASSVVATNPAGLQSIIISKTRRAAIIDGETVELGGKYGDAKLIAINEGGIVLYGAQGRQTMTLFPDVKMTMVKRAAGEFRGAAKNAAKDEAGTKRKLKIKPQSLQRKASGQKANQAESGEVK